jgi:hypothetical protein
VIGLADHLAIETVALCNLVVGEEPRVGQMLEVVQRAHGRDTMFGKGGGRHGTEQKVDLLASQAERRRLRVYRAPRDARSIKRRKLVVVLSGGQQFEGDAGRSRGQAAQQREDKRLRATARAAGQNWGDVNSDLQVDTSRWTTPE